MTEPLNAILIAAGPHPNHDFDFARLRLLEAVYSADPSVRTRTLSSYEDVEKIESADLLLTYNSQLTPDESQCAAVQRFLQRGGRWFAMHASNSIPAGPLPSVIGSRFISHPPYMHFDVSITNARDPLVAGIEPFELDDELYVMDVAPDVEVLLNTRWGGAARRAGRRGGHAAVDVPASRGRR